MEFGLIPHDDWFQPSWIDEEKATAGRKKMEEDNVIYGGKLITAWYERARHSNNGTHKVLCREYVFGSGDG